MKKTIFSLLFAVALICNLAHASTSTLTGSIKNAQGSGINGTLIMTLPVPATDGSSAISPGPVVFRLVNGTITGGAPLYDVGSLQPLGLYYSARAYDTMGFLQFYGNYAVTGATFNLAAAIPTTVTTSNISYLNPATTNGNNTFTGTNIFTQGLQVNVSGTGCGQSFFLQNTDTTPTNPNKYFRINRTTGALEVMNSACSSMLFSMDDTGAIIGPVANDFIISAASITGNGKSLFLNGGTGTGGSAVGGSVTLRGGPGGLIKGSVAIGDLNTFSVTLGDVAGAVPVNILGKAQIKGTPLYVYIDQDFTLAANTNLQRITGLTQDLRWTLAANTTQAVPFSCHLLYSQATAAVADQFGIQMSGLAPGNLMVKSEAQISASAQTNGNVPTLTTTTATPIVTFTPSAITTIWNADIEGFIETQSGAQATVDIMAQTSNAADLLTVKRGSFCHIN